MNGNTGNWASASTGADEERRSKNIPVMVGVFAAATALLGGSSRYDAGQLIILQPFAWLAAGFFLFFVRRTDLLRAKWPIILLVTLTALMFLQLVPLPAGLWTSLPGRAVIENMDAALGPVPTRPWSMMPTRTINAFASLAIPIAALLAYLALGKRHFRVIAFALLAVAFANTVIGLLQTLSSGTTFLDFYGGEPDRSARGLFANTNHSGVFGALIMVFIIGLIVSAGKAISRSQQLMLYGLYTFLFLGCLMSGSRAALLASIIALAATAVVTFRQSASPARNSKKQVPVAAILTTIAGTAVVLVFVLSDRLPAFEQLVATDPLQDIRFAFMPTLVEMAIAYFPFGSGFGTFEDVYYIHEKDILLQGAYLNMAHNDWLQTVIEAGLPGLLLLLGTIAWFASIAVRLIKSGHTSLFIIFAAGFAIIAMASYFDYPLRTPLLQMAAIWLLLLISDASMLPVHDPQVRRGGVRRSAAK